MLENLVGATVTATKIDTFESISFTTNSLGNVNFTNLPEGDYNVTVTKSGLGLKVDDIGNTIDDTDANSVLTTLPWKVSVSSTKNTNITLVFVNMSQPLMNISITINQISIGDKFAFTITATSNVTPITDFEIIFDLSYNLVVVIPVLNAELFDEIATLVFTAGNSSSIYTSPLSDDSLTGASIGIDLTTHPIEVTGLLGETVLGTGVVSSIIIPEIV